MLPKPDENDAGLQLQKYTDQAWAADIRRIRHIGDLTRWKDHDAYQRGLQRLLRDLKQEKV